VLVVDDDVRNIFALASLLERYEMEVLYAEDGQTGINMLQTHPSIDVVLMDVMMPEMDGYTTMQRIRQISQFSSLPIIALTAKAMQGDREQCLAAGASDYIPKPVDSDRLLALLRAWLD
jgi:CheY-like chemotaxis protein